MQTTHAGKAHGKGMLRDSGISIFRGTMVNGMKQGLGIHVFHNKMTYKGNFHEDKWHGLGMLSVRIPAMLHFVMDKLDNKSIHHLLTKFPVELMLYVHVHVHVCVSRRIHANVSNICMYGDFVV